MHSLCITGMTSKFTIQDKSNIQGYVMSLEYLNVSTSWNYMELEHPKAPFDPISGTTKQKADEAVKNDKSVI